MMRALLLALLLTACAATQAAPAQNHLAGTSWIMVFPPDHAPVAAPPTIEFSDTRASGFAGCNRWFAAIAHDGEALTFSDVGTTRMACPEPAMSIERGFVAGLANTRYAHYDGDALVLLDAQRRAIARYERSR
jgi:heat shock protein HslJ